jgi:hypothetical protein
LPDGALPLLLAGRLLLFTRRRRHRRSSRRLSPKIAFDGFRSPIFFAFITEIFFAAAATMLDRWRPPMLPRRCA